MNKYHLIAITAILLNFGILAALEGGAIGCGMTLLLAIPAQGLLIWSLDHSGWIDTEAVEADKLAMVEVIKEALRRGDEKRSGRTTKHL